MTFFDWINAISYRRLMTVKEHTVYLNGGGACLCPRCKIPIDREYQCYCDRCGQALDWELFSRVVEDP